MHMPVLRDYHSCSNRNSNNSNSSCSCNSSCRQCIQNMSTDSHGIAEGVRPPTGSPHRPLGSVEATPAAAGGGDAAAAATAVFAAGTDAQAATAVSAGGGDAAAAAAAATAVFAAGSDAVAAATAVSAAGSDAAAATAVSAAGSDAAAAQAEAASNQGRGCLMEAAADPPIAAADGTAAAEAKEAAATASGDKDTAAAERAAADCSARGTEVLATECLDPAELCSVFFQQVQQVVPEDASSSYSSSERCYHCSTSEAPLTATSGAAAAAAGDLNAAALPPPPPPPNATVAATAAVGNIPQGSNKICDFEADADESALNKISLEYSYEEVYAATNGFRHMLGLGAYGVVYRGFMRDGLEVAVKRLNDPSEAGFEREVVVLSKFRHPNLVILLGFARHGKDRFLIYEMMAGGDVAGHLQRGTLTWLDRLCIALDTSIALSHLHRHCPTVYHRDIKTANILLDRHKHAKVSDFGLACLAKKGKGKFPVRQTAGTVGYADPKYIASSLVSEMAEVYSLGMVMLELLTAKPPVMLNSDGSITFVLALLARDMPRLLRAADTRAGFPPSVLHIFAEVAISCIRDDDTKRPSFQSIVRQLRCLKEAATSLCINPKSSSLRDWGFSPLALRGAGGGPTVPEALRPLRQRLPPSPSPYAATKQTRQQHTTGGCSQASDRAAVGPLGCKKETKSAASPVVREEGSNCSESSDAQEGQQQQQQQQHFVGNEGSSIGRFPLSAHEALLPTLTHHSPAKPPSESYTNIETAEAAAAAVATVPLPVPDSHFPVAHTGLAAAVATVTAGPADDASSTTAAAATTESVASLAAACPAAAAAAKAGVGVPVAVWTSASCSREGAAAAAAAAASRQQSRSTGSLPSDTAEQQRDLELQEQQLRHELEVQQQQQLQQQQLKQQQQKKGLFALPHTVTVMDCVTEGETPTAAEAGGNQSAAVSMPSCAAFLSGPSGDSVILGAPSWPRSERQQQPARPRRHARKCGKKQQQLLLAAEGECRLTLQQQRRLRGCTTSTSSTMTHGGSSISMRNSGSNICSASSNSCNSCCYSNHSIRSTVSFSADRLFRYADFLGEATTQGKSPSSRASTRSGMLVTAAAAAAAAATAGMTSSGGVTPSSTAGTDSSRLLRSFVATPMGRVVKRTTTPTITFQQQQQQQQQQQVLLLRKQRRVVSSRALVEPLAGGDSEGDPQRKYLVAAAVTVSSWNAADTAVAATAAPTATAAAATQPVPQLRCVRSDCSSSHENEVVLDKPQQQKTEATSGRAFGFVTSLLSGISLADKADAVLQHQRVAAAQQPAVAQPPPPPAPPAAEHQQLQFIQTGREPSLVSSMHLTTAGAGPTRVAPAVAAAPLSRLPPTSPEAKAAATAAKAAAEAHAAAAAAAAAVGGARRNVNVIGTSRMLSVCVASNSAEIAEVQLPPSLLLQQQQQQRAGAIAVPAADPTALAKPAGTAGTVTGGGLQQLLLVQRSANLSKLQAFF